MGHLPPVRTILHPHHALRALLRAGDEKRAAWTANGRAVRG